MIKIPFSVLPINIQNNDLPTLNPDDVELLGDLEYLSLDHWLLGVDSDSLDGVVNGTSLTPMSDLPTYSSNHITFSAAKGKALETEFDADTDITICIVYKSSGGTAYRSIFTGGALNPEGTGYYMFHASSQTAISQIVGVSPSRPTFQPSITGDWQFLALSIRPNETVVADGGATQTESYSGTPTKSTRKIAIGSSYQDFTDEVDLNVAEFIVFPRGLTASELQDVYARSKVRMSERGISI